MIAKLLTIVFVGLGFVTAFCQSDRQLTISAQLRTRTELRDGQGTLAIRDTVPAFFTSQRSRINLGFSSHRLKLYTSIQDVRVWGQDASSINRNNATGSDGFMVHEAWAEISLIDTGKVVKNFTLKIGRQELVYDDVRLLGNLDWLQQARRHDAAVLKFDHGGWTAHLGAAFNQNAERKSNTIYNGVPSGYAASTNGMSSMYKSLQFAYIAKKFSSATVSFLSVKDDFSRFHFAADDLDKKNPVYEQRVWSRITTGANAVGTLGKKLNVAASAFYQGGRYREGTSLDEYLLSLSAIYQAGKKYSTGAGVDITSGNNGADASRKFQRFDPLYGTPHKFWGHMDYFYVADGFGSNGLIDLYLKNKFHARENLFCTLDVHHFSLPGAVTDESGATLTKTLGTELDFIFNYGLTRQINFEAGYCTLFASPTLASPRVKNVPRADNLATWAYLMIAIKPEISFKH
ncbi:MAG TPA: alginate export family protein [Chryseosolibacter sp.]